MPTTLTFNSLQDDLHVYAERAFTSASDPLVFAQIPRLINLAERRCATELKVQGFIKNVTSTFQPGLDVYDKPDRWREWISVNMGTAELFNTVSRSGDGTFVTLVFDRPHPFRPVSPPNPNGIIIVSGLGLDPVGDPAYNGVYPVTGFTQLSVTYQGGIGTMPVEPVTADSNGLVSISMQKRSPVLPRSYEYIRGFWPDPTLTGRPVYYGDYDYYHFIIAPVPDRPYPFELNYYELPPMLDAGHQTNWLTDIAPNLLLYASLKEMAPFLKNMEMTAAWDAEYARAGQALTGQDLDKIQDRTSERTKP